MGTISYVALLLVVAGLAWGTGLIVKRSLASGRITYHRSVWSRDEDPITFWIVTCIAGVLAAGNVVLTIYLLTTAPSAFSEECRNASSLAACSEGSEQGR